MSIRKFSALISATLFLVSFTILPALAILNHPSQQLTTAPVAAEMAESIETTHASQLFTAPHRQSTQDDADLAAQIVAPVHKSYEAAESQPETTLEPATTPAPTSAPAKKIAQPTVQPTPTLAPADLAQTDDALSRSKSALSADGQTGSIVRMPWFGEAECVYAKGDVATVIDLETGIRIQIMRTGGHNHADCETIDATETAKLLQVAGGEWNWTRRPIIIEIDGQRVAASMTCRPHAGLDNQPALETVRNRSGGFGTGINYDSVKGNDMDGHFDIHFYKSRTHSTNQVDSQHQAAIQVAYQSGL